MSDVQTKQATPATGKYVLPKPPRTGGLTVTANEGAALSGSRRHAEAARVLGDRSLALVECQQQFLTELRDRLNTLDAAVAEDSRARLKGAVRAALDVVDWCDAVQQDLQRESVCASQGWLPHDLEQVCAEAATAAHGCQVLVAGSAVVAWWGDGTMLHQLLELGIELVRDRTAGQGAIVLEVGERDGVHSLRVASAGDPVDQVEPASARRFRAIADQLGVTVLPDHLGVGGAGMVLRLPVKELLPVG